MRIAVFLPNWVGDAVMAAPALRALREHFAGARLIGVMKPYVAGVLEGAPWMNEQILLDRGGPWSRRWPAVALRLRRQRPAPGVGFSNPLRPALVARPGRRRHLGRYARARRGPLCD